MAGYIPDDIVERIKAESDIVSVVSGFVNLKKSGKDFKGLCPFHQEKTPSFYVIPNKGFYHCFGCGAGGNSVNFIMAHERLDYPEALRYLAAKAGITIPETSEKKSSTEILFEAMTLAGAYFTKSLKGTETGERALSYMRSRGLTNETASVFGIGYAPPGWDGLLKAASSKGIQAGVLERVGLAIKKEGYYDRFRDRLMIPIRTISGRVVGFGGRVLPGDDGPKYINSPETEIYKKGKLLFGLDIARDAIREQNEAIVVEGYFDLISLYQAGVKNVVAVSGTGFTSDQAALLARFCERIVLLYDSDSAGIKAAFRACGVLYDTGAEPKIIRLPKGHDPDSFVREAGKEGLLKQVAGATDVIDFIKNGIAGKFADQPLSRQEKIIKALAETIGLIQDPLRRGLLAKRISDKFDLPPGTLDVGVRKAPPDSRTEASAKSPGREKPEREFLALLLSHQEYIDNREANIDSSLFVDEINARLFDLIRSMRTQGDTVNVSGLFDRLEDEKERQRLSEIGMIEFDPDEMELRYRERLDALQLIAVKKRLQELKAQIAEAESGSRPERLQELLGERQKLNEFIRDYTAKRKDEALA
jgi:DNA primase